MDMQNGYDAGQQNQGNSLLKFLLGLFTGVAVATPVTALVVKKICDKNKEQEINNAITEAENRGIQAMAEVCMEEIKNGAEQANRAHFEASRSISDDKSTKVEEVSKNDGGSDYNEAYLASLQSPTDDDGTDYDLENYNLTIDDEEASQEASEFSDAHVKYLEMIERYKNVGGNIPPMAINREQFQNEHFFQKSYINWYEDDDVFEEDDSKIEDPVYTFGFVNGRDMFKPELTALRDEEDICYVRNMNMSTDFEITRVHGSYQKLVIDGEAYYHGEANSQY